MLNNPKSNRSPKFSPIQEGKISDFSDLRWQFADKNWMKNPATLDYQWVTGFWGAQNRTRTCTPRSTRTWNERVYHSATWAIADAVWRLLSASIFVGVKGFEPSTPCSQSRCANRTALRPEIECKITPFFWNFQIFGQLFFKNLYFLFSNAIYHPQIWVSYVF